MTRIQKIAGLLMTVLSAVAVYCFFAIKYPYHLHFQEQYQLFEFSCGYFRDVVSVPGGLADWAGRFLTQFFYYAPAGAVILALLFCAVQRLTWRLCPQRTPAAYALSFLPAAALVVFFCDENALVGGAVALLLSQAAAVLVARVSADGRRHVLEAVLVPLLYFACGPLAVVYVLLAARAEAVRCGRRALPVLAALLLLAVLCPFVASRLVAYPLGRLCLGVHYYRYHNIVPGLLWAAALAAVCVPPLAGIRSRILSGTPAGLGLFALVAALGVFFTFRASDASKEEWMRYDFMVRMGMWNRIMMTADARNPDNPKTVSCLNLALARSGRLADSQFEYFQNGPEGLLPEFVGDYTNPVSSGEIYWHLGMVNTAQRFAFEAQEAIPDFQKSARLYRRLAQTNIVNGDDAVARKYLKPLTRTLFYRKWARETLALLDAGDIFVHRPELAQARDRRLKEHDFLFSAAEMDSMLGLLKVENPANTMALDYLMAWCLLRKDLDRFVECLGLLEAPAMPKAYQEALLLRWAQTHDSFEGMPPYLSPAHALRMNRFIQDMQAGKPEAELLRSYGDTYWFYYYYRYRSR
ncbi:hypothetical protein SAMN06298214_0349 [Bacteroidales bacterium WCE2004]|nr:hypothetical protein SAMN06298214_0349 [Bacteroidales bacterium WCE2004]